MLQIQCPHCGRRDHPEFTYGGDAAPTRPDTALGGDAAGTRPDTALEVDDDAWVAYLFLRENPDSAHREYWHHTYGCRLWLEVVRDTTNNVISEVAVVRSPRIPQSPRASRSPRASQAQREPRAPGAPRARASEGCR